MPISRKIRQYRPLLGFAHPGEVLWSAEWAWGSCTQAGNMVGFYAPNSGWLSLWGARDWSLWTKQQSIIGGSLWAQVAMRISILAKPVISVSWFDISRLFWVVVWLPFCPTPPILTLPFPLCRDWATISQEKKIEVRGSGSPQFFPVIRALRTGLPRFPAPSAVLLGSLVLNPKPHCTFSWPTSKSPFTPFLPAASLLHSSKLLRESSA